MPALLFLQESPSCLVCCGFVVVLVALSWELWQKTTVRSPLQVAHKSWGLCKSVQVCVAVPGQAARGAECVPALWEPLRALLKITQWELILDPSWK